jgi:hypothetical protein
MKLNPAIGAEPPRVQHGEIKIPVAKAEPGNRARSMSGGEVAVNTKHFGDISGAINGKRKKAPANCS